MKDLLVVFGFDEANAMDVFAEDLGVLEELDPRVRDVDEGQHLVLRRVFHVDAPVDELEPKLGQLVALARKHHVEGVGSRGRPQRRRHLVVFQPDDELGHDGFLEDSDHLL